MLCIELLLLFIEWDSINYRFSNHYRLLLWPHLILGNTERIADPFSVYHKTKQNKNLDIFFLHFSEDTRTAGSWRAGICYWVKFWEDVIGLQVWGRIALSQLEELAPIQVELFFYIWPKDFWALVYLLRNPQGCFIHEEIFSQTLLLFLVLGLLSQQAALSLCKTGTHYIPSSCLPHPMWVPRSEQKKDPYCRVVLSDSEAHRHK